MISLAQLSNNTIINKDKYQAGIAFNLSVKHELNDILRLQNGWELVLDSNSQYIIVRGNSTETDPEALFNECYEMIQRGLDLLSINGKGDISIQDVVDDYTIWWKDKNKQILRIVRVSDFTMGSSTEITIIDSNGNKSKGNKVTPTKYHESLRYYRLSQITDDLFDSFRNMYLSFELLLSLQTVRRRGEKEGDWLKRALNEFKQLQQISHLLKPLNANVVDKFYKQIYVDVRCCLFHAKEGKRRLLPQNLDDRKKVGESLDILTQVVLMLASKLLHTNRENSVITNIGFSHMIDNALNDSKILLSNSDKALSMVETLSDSIHKESFSFRSSFSKNLSIPGLRFVSASIDPSKIMNVDTINRFALQIEEELFSVHQISKGLTLENIDELQFKLGYRLDNKNLPKRRFKY